MGSGWSVGNAEGLDVRCKSRSGLGGDDMRAESANGSCMTGQYLSRELKSAAQGHGPLCH